MKEAENTITKLDKQTPPQPALTVDDVLKEVGSRKPCSHGFRQDLLLYEPYVHVQHVWTFHTHVYKNVQEIYVIDPMGNVINALNAARQATQISMFHLVWTDASRLEWITSYFVTEGTKQFLQGRETMARHSAIMANHFEQSKAVTNKEQPQIIPAKMAELLRGDVKTLVTYYRQRYG